MKLFYARLNTNFSKVIFFLTFLSVLAGCQNAPEFEGYTLLEKRFVKEVNADCYFLEHDGSGAQVLKIAADDPNKTFSISFNTIPESDCGTPHIMEHSVLNGSKNFPVKSPFDVLSKGSLNTFLNAMTGPDMTYYPVASMNEKDYYNLMHVYLDAVFNPLIYDDPRIFEQEGWHYELTDPEEPVSYKGVVYNEMKGAFSSPERERGYLVFKNLFPENGYGFSSGGYPEAIPDLTYEDFLAFHTKYYHPNNSYIILYGDADMGKELAFIDSAYLSKYERSGFRAEIPLHAPYDSPKALEAVYSATEGSSTENQTFLSMSFVTGEGSDIEAYVSQMILADVLVNQESAPIRKALLEAEIGRDVYAYSNFLKQNVFEIVVQNANPEDSDKFKEVVMSALKEAAEKELDQEAAEGAFNRIEFEFREGDDAQKGLTYGQMALLGWKFKSDPFLTLQYNAALEQVKTNLKEGYLEDFVKKQMLDNPYTLLLVLKPEPGLEKIKKAKIEEELTAFKAGLSGEAIQKLVDETQALIAYQREEDTPENLATIPMLQLSDINPESEFYGIDEVDNDGVTILHYDVFTNNVVYERLMFDLYVLPLEDIPYARLLTEFMGKLDTENHSYEDLEKELNIHLGGFNIFLNTYLENQNSSTPIAQLQVSAKSMNDKVDKMIELTAEILNHTKFDDSERLGELLTRHQSQLESGVKNNGLWYALYRLKSYISNSGMYDELTEGLSYFDFVTDLSKDFENNPEPLTQKLNEIASKLFSKGNMMAATTCSSEDLAKIKDGFSHLAETFETEMPGMNEWNFELSVKNEGLMAASKVQYVLKGSDYRKFGYDWDGRMEVLSQILSTDWLQNQIRVIGGAYGGFTFLDRSGTFIFASYRDPNLKGTLDNYDATPGYLKEFDADEATITRYLIGTIAGIDYPRTPSQKGSSAVRYYFEKTTKEDLQKEREAVLSTTVQDIRDMEAMVTQILKQNVYCVYGNQELLMEHKDMFGELILTVK